MQLGWKRGKDPVIKILDTKVEEEIYRGKPRQVTYYSVKVNRYYAVGIRYQNLSYEEFESIQAWQNKTGVQVIYPYVDSKDIKNITDNANIWYKVKDQRGTPALDSDGNLVPAYSKDTSRAGAEYNSLRIAGDDGSYAYSRAKSGSVQCRIEYYAYYQFLNDTEPMYLFGTNVMGQDLFCAIGIGARFSLIFAVIVSAINLTIGAIYGAVQGYYGGRH